MRVLVLPASCALLILGSACYINRAVLDPWAYAPRTPRTTWMAPARLNLKGHSFEQVLPDEETPLTLAEALDIALQNSPTTRITWAQARQAAANYAETQAADLPTLTGYYNWQRSRSLTGSNVAQTSVVQNQTGAVPGQAPTQTAPSPTILYLSTWGPQLSLSYTVLDFGQSRATSEAARYALYFSDWTHNRAIQTLIQTVTDDYYNYLYQRQLLKANEADLTTAKTTLASATLGLRTGVNDVSDELQARTQMIQAELQLLSQKQTLETAYAQLLNDMGLPANLCFAVEELPLVKPTEEMLTDASELLELALSQRADLLAAEANVRSKEESVRAAKLQFLPTLSYTLNFGRTYYTGNINDNYDFVSTLSFSVPIFNGFSTLNNVRLAKANREQSQAQLLQTKLAIIQQITTAHYNVKIAFDSLKCANAFLEAAAEQYRVVLSQYRAGTNTITNVVSAQSSLADARAKEAFSAQNWFTSLTALAYATGSLSESNLGLPQ
jgi:outer membrane protein